MCSEWPLIPLRDFVDLLAGFAFKSTGYSDGQDDVRLLRGDNIAPGRVRWDGVKRWSRENAIGLERYALEPGDVVLAMDRPWIPAGLKVAQVQAADTPSYLVQRVARIRPASREDCSFLFALLSTPEFESYIQNVTTGTAVPHISAKQILDFEFRLPPAYVRAKVGEIVAALNERITLLRETNTTLEAIAQALFKSWFVDFDPVHARARGEQPAGLAPEVAALFPDSFEESALGMVPKGWQAEPLDEIADFLNGLALQKYPPEGDETLPVIKIAQLRKGDTVGADRASRNIKPEYIIQNGDVLFSWSGSLEVEVWCGGEGALNQHLFKVTSQRFQKWFYLRWTKTHLTNFKHIAASKATTMGHIQRKHLTEAMVVVPSSQVLAEADKIFGPLLDQWINNAEQAQTLANLRDTLLPRLISGQLRLPDAEQQLKDLAV
ncbi:restriction endonuclease subunit S [Aeromonas caviae]|uniref:restriction endonuclease subunit S n=1 Tax=Aeromonas TaxID=642 RepID=UPI000CDDE55A|nr:MULTISPECIES: restriction endonuclease subunit S [Aeromonas]MDH0350403.1 restriction endonuclease subunit S [Aeromonas caviae]MDX7730530.1 restriction endonuclease subunit S [Aeromonas caviae]POV87549.1 restriction endonuclease subunit S [Aeromonas sp. ASNIH8]